MLKRVFTGAVFALVLGLLTFTISQAQTDPQIYGSDDCGDCHEPVMTQWENSVHSQATVPEGFSASSGEKDTDCFRCAIPDDETADNHGGVGMTCENCHPSDPAEHPQKIMQTDISAQLCGQCHDKTLAEWEVSQHGQEELACARCHNPHSNELRLGTMEATCRSCHKTETHLYTFTAHAGEGIVCTDCHLQASSDEAEGSHRSHTFAVDSDACSTCHGDEMHLPSNASAQTGDAPTVMQASFLSNGSHEAVGLQTEPSVNSSYNFAVLAGLIGMAFGLVGSPWLERWQERLRSQDSGGNDGQ